uniref:Cyclin-T1-3-like isoform X2 n=1 Tax=Rhizophora mucronata TaxID=61149 RepID=A0A2P2LR05_RHIMU
MRHDTHNSKQVRQISNILLMENLRRYSQHIIERTWSLLRLCSKKKSSGSNQLQLKAEHHNQNRCRRQDHVNLAWSRKYSWNNGKY